MASVAPSFLAKGIAFLRERNMTNIAFREVVGDNLPHTAIVRTTDEAIDQGIIQFGNSAAMFGGGMLYSKALEFASKKLYPSLSQHATAWLHLGRSFALFAVLGSYVFSSSKLRNYITMQRTASLNYTDFIGETNAGSDRQSPEYQQKLKQAKHNNLSFFRNSLLAGAGLSLAFLGFSHGLIRWKTPFPKLLTPGWLIKSSEVVHNKLSWFPRLSKESLGLFIKEGVGLKHGQFEHLAVWGANLCWVLPTFSGLLLGSRDGYEKKEIGLRFAAFNVNFFILPKLMDKLIGQIPVEKIPKLLGHGADRAKNLGWVAEFLTTAALCSAMPSVINIFLTHKRVTTDEAKKTPPIAPVSTPISLSVSKPMPSSFTPGPSGPQPIPPQQQAVALAALVVARQQQTGLSAQSQPIR